jgi:hypothetical protein
MREQAKYEPISMVLSGEGKGATVIGQRRDAPTPIDTEAGWSKSGWHGWWYG